MTAPAEALRPFETIIGRWKTSGSVLDEHGAPVTTIDGTDEYEWMVGGLYMASSRTCFRTILRTMRSLTVTEVKARLNELVDDAESTHEQIVITKHGRPAAVIIAAEDLESLQETVYWLSRPGIRESIAEAEADIAADRTIGSDELRAKLGLPPP